MIFLPTADAIVEVVVRREGWIGWWLERRALAAIDDAGDRLISATMVFYELSALGHHGSTTRGRSKYKGASFMHLDGATVTGTLRLCVIKVKGRER